MKISYNWLKELIAFKETPEELTNILTSTGLEVEGIEKFNGLHDNSDEIVIGLVETCKPHPNAERLAVTTVDVGTDTPLRIVCGAPNVAVGQKVVVARPGAILHPLGQNEPLQIENAVIRGIESQGMLCSEDELGLGASHEGIIVLKTELPPGTPAATYFRDLEDHVIEIGLTPNRADAASHYGVARDLKAALNLPVTLPVTDNIVIDNHDLPIIVEVHNTQAAPRYAGVTMSDISVDDSPEWLRRRLEAIGVRPINNIVDITNYVCHELGQPLHAFDYDKISGGKVVVRTFPEGTQFTTLDGVQRKLRSNDLVIADAEKPMCVAGVFGGLDSGVTRDTASIFLESAYFSPEWVRRTSQHMGLKTDSSFRFERGTDPNMPVQALRRAVKLIREIAGGKVSSGIVDHYPDPVSNFRVEVKYKNIDRLIGKKIDRYTIQKILFNLDIRYEKENEEGFLAVVPPYRVDVLREADIIEEILRIYGFDQIELSEDLKSDFLSPFPAKDPGELLIRTGNTLTANGFFEIINNSLVKPGPQEVISEELKGEDVKIVNYLSEDLSVLRRTLLFSVLDTIAHNVNRRQKNLKLFEFGKTYHLENGGYVEKNRLGIGMIGLNHQESWFSPGRPLAFHDLASAVSNVLTVLRSAPFKTEKYSGKLYASGVSWRIGENQVAQIGLVAPEIARISGIKGDVYYAELDWDFLIHQYSDSVIHREISKYPEVRRDLSLVIDKSVTFDALEQTARATEQNLLKEINVFDVYEGESLGGRKAYALAFTIQDETHTLTDQEIDHVMQNLIHAFETKFNAVIRK